MNMNEVRKIAKDMGLSTSKRTKVELIRAIQDAEGNLPCYGTGKATECGQSTCLWREECH